MPVQPPPLNDLRFDDFVEEMLARIPAHTPEYTNPRPGDPGRTMIELFAWLADTILYRANLIPERQRLTFLRLLGIQMRPALPAATVVALSNDGDSITAARTIRAEATLKGPVDFETRRECVVLPVTAQAYYKRPLIPDERARMQELLDGLTDWYTARGMATNALDFYVTTPIFAGGALDQTGLDIVRDTVDGCLWLALLAAKPEQKDAVRRALGEGQAGAQQVLNVGVMPGIEAPTWNADVGVRARLPHVWEISGLDKGKLVYSRLDPILDTTAELTQRGIQRLLLPRTRLIGAPDSDLRADLEAGVGGQPPRLDDPELDDRVVTWLRLRPTQELSSMPVSWVGINAVPIDQYQTVRYRVIGQSTGAPDQRFPLPATSAEAASLVIEVEEPGMGYRAWRQIPDLELAGRDDAVYSLNSREGAITFGYGMKGRIPPVGMRVRVAFLRAGGGVAGNLPPGTLKAIDARDLDDRSVSQLTVIQALPADGGMDAETLAEAERRIPAMLRVRDRAVTAEDYRVLAAATPGRPIGRVEVLPRFRPNPPRAGMAGVVSVMALPMQPGFDGPNPRADRPLLEAVYQQLDARRPLTAELYVIGCEYVSMGVSVGIDIREGFAREDVLNRVRLALRAFLWPLAPGGFEGQGWELGQAVVDRDVELTVARVPGVSRLRGARVNLFQHNAATDALVKLPRLNDNATVQITLARYQLPELVALSVLAGEDPVDNVQELAVEFFGQQQGPSLPIPVVPEVCR